VERLGELVPAGNAAGIVLIADGRAAEHWGEAAEASLSSIAPVHRLLVESGEPSKSLSVAASVLESMSKLEVRRDDLVVTLGGGMVCDLGGFVASVYHRGIRVVHVPTTLLAQADASVVGKTGLNLTSGKNLVGTFHHPVAVISDIATLGTLGERELLSGMAEVIKCGLACDPSLLSTLEVEREAVLARGPETLEEVVARSVEIKARLVFSDARDLSGERAMLNYGHTFGHALEAAGDYRRWLHGEAISVGMVFAAELAGHLGLLDEEGVSKHRGVLNDYGLPTQAEFSLVELMGHLAVDKKRRGRLRWVLLEALGRPVLYEEVSQADIEAAAAEVRA
jgi:3-dehydroquinate synthase